MEIDKSRFVKELVTLGAKKVRERQIITYFFDAPVRILQRKKQVLRLRQDGKRVFIAFKSPKGRFRQEIEFEIKGLQEAKELFEALGFEVVLKTVKRRTSYKLQGAVVDIDEYLGEFSFIPPFAEVEAKSVATLDSYLARLKRYGKKVVRWSTVKLLSYYKDPRGRSAI